MRVCELRVTGFRVQPVPRSQALGEAASSGQLKDSRWGLVRVLGIGFVIRSSKRVAGLVLG